MVFYYLDEGFDLAFGRTDFHFLSVVLSCEFLGSYGGKMLPLLFPDITDGSMFLWKQKQIRLLPSTIMHL